MRIIRKIEKPLRSIVDDKKIMMITAIIVFAVAVLASYVLANTATTRADVQYDNYVEDALDNLNAHISTRLASYQVLLKSSAGLVNIAQRDNLTADDWRSYVSTLSSDQTISDLQGIGFTEFVEEDDLVQHMARLSREHGFEVSIEPEDDRDTYTTISYLAPMDEENRRAIGYDMYSDPVRNAAMSSARDDGEVAMTLPVISVQDQELDKPQKTILMYYPVYRTSAIPSSLEERRQSIIGFTYLLFRGGDLLSDYTEFSNDGQVFTQIRDTTNSQDVKTIYQSEGFDAEGLTLSNRELAVGERTWNTTLYLENTPRLTILSPLWIFILGIILSALLSYALYIMLLRRNEIIVEEHEEKISQTKNDLVALASHQLRTPATGTRQYIGMLIEDYFGPLTDEQRDIAVRAYKANERQLAIVDEILYVAKADSGQIFLNRTNFDIVKLLHELVAENQENAQKKNIDVSFTTRRKSLMIEADSKYITMVIENILGNSLKYSYPDSSVAIKLSMNDKNTIKISFSDNGVGISSEDQPRLFDKFARIDNPLSHIEGGSGLGLYLANKLVIAHGGKINVDSEADKGSKFIVILPIEGNDSENVVQLTE